MSKTDETLEKVFLVEKVNPTILYGIEDRNLRILEKHFPAVKMIARGTQVKIRGPREDVEQVESILSELVFIANKNNQLSPEDVESLAHIVKADQHSRSSPAGTKTLHTPKELDEVVLFTRGGYIKARTAGQRKIIEAIRKNDLVVVIGPAGTGKTYMAVALAVAALKEKEVKKIVLARPAVEAGESLGFLPGDYREKIDPYLRPLYDSLEEMLPKELLRKYLEQGIIEVIPLAYMRGRTLNNAFVILDEAQNATSLQMKMFLTRLGVNSRAIVNGDITQIDLPQKSNSGLLEIQEILQGVEGIEFVYLDKADVVRHRLVRDIIQAYQEHKNQQNSTEG
ncbi:MAG: PhoH family protein [Calditrichaeota bacterium]|nr:MAG: PhoH family protein [Calditrichota bacterium]